MALTQTPESIDPVPCPDFTLKGLDGKFHSLEEYKNGQPLLVMFICNHCPYVKAIEDRLVQLALDLKKENISTVAICANDPSAYEEDSFDNLQKRWIEKKFPFSYLHDPDQVAAKAFGAVCTPDFFLYDKKGLLKYRGRLDDSWKDPSRVTRRELYTAALDLKYKDSIGFSQTPSMGCSIKWIKDKESI